MERVRYAEFRRIGPLGLGSTKTVCYAEGSFFEGLLQGGVPIRKTYIHPGPAKTCCYAYIRT